jgi:hypothetical protein
MLIDGKKYLGDLCGGVDFKFFLDFSLFSLKK